jgi:hypothetical protein
MSHVESYCLEKQATIKYLLLLLLLLLLLFKNSLLHQIKVDVIW